MRRLGLMVVIAAFAAAALNVALRPAGAAAAGCLYINKIYYDSPGADTGSNASLNDEWIRLKSSCATSKSLASFKVRDAAGNTYTFGSFTLAAGATVKIHSGKGTNTTSNRYWGRTTYVWGNTKDTARLYDASAYVVHSCSYNSSAVNAKTCAAGTYL
jgi:hypothetical protein